MDGYPGMDNWKTKMRRELFQAEAARAAGNEGRARVCARRAAGIIAAEYLERHGIVDSTPSAYNLLRHLQSSDNLPPDVREKIAHFLMRVDSDFRLPEEIDLIADTQWLAESLLGDSL